MAACSPTSAQNLDASEAGMASPTPIIVRILNLDAALSAIPTITPEPTLLIPTPILLPSPTLISVESGGTLAQTAATPPACTNQAEFVRNLSVADNASLDVGQAFTKIWQIKNTGTCTWSTDYTLRFFSGDAMGGPEVANLANPVAPGETIDIRIDLVAPMKAYTSTGTWVLSDPQGNLFGFGKTGSEPLAVIIQIKPTPRPTPG